MGSALDTPLGIGAFTDAIKEAVTKRDRTLASQLIRDALLSRMDDISREAESIADVLDVYFEQPEIQEELDELAEMVATLLERKAGWVE